MPHKHCSLSDITERLRQRSHKITIPRQTILSILRNEAHPLTCKEVHSRMPQGECNLATIYRSLHLLEKMALVKRFDFGDGIARFELTQEEGTAHHHHLICTRCFAIVEIEACFPEEFETRIAKTYGYHGVTHKLEFFGICPRCATTPIPSTKKV